VSDFFKRFGKEVCRVFNTRDMNNINGVGVDTVTDEMSTYVNMLHAWVGMGVMAAGNSALVVTVEKGGMGLWEAKFFEEWAKPNDLASTMGAWEVFCLTGGKSDDGLLLGAPGNRATPAFNNIARNGLAVVSHSPIGVCECLESCCRVIIAIYDTSISSAMQVT
jgi:hypothetical protein